MKDARSRVVRFDADGKNPLELKLPGIGTVGGFGGKEKDKQVFYSFTSFTDPGAIYRLRSSTGAKASCGKSPRSNSTAARMRRSRSFTTARTAREIPMFIVHIARAFRMDGSNRTLLYGYGGFQISELPGFAVTDAVWLERGGILAVANLRGGGEYGSAWHDAGKGSNKQNVFDDFIAAAECLIEKGLHQAREPRDPGRQQRRLAGRRLHDPAARTVWRRPARGRRDGHAAFPEIHHRLGLGKGIRQFRQCRATSRCCCDTRRYHALKPGTRYPATLVTTADHDDRVVPAHSFKFAARLQEYQAHRRPAGADPRREQRRPRRRHRPLQSRSTARPTNGASWKRRCQEVERRTSNARHRTSK